MLQQPLARQLLQMYCLLLGALTLQQPLTSRSFLSQTYPVKHRHKKAYSKAYANAALLSLYPYKGWLCISPSSSVSSVLPWIEFLHWVICRLLFPRLKRTFQGMRWSESLTSNSARSRMVCSSCKSFNRRWSSNSQYDEVKVEKAGKERQSSAGFYLPTESSWCKLCN